MMLRETYRSLKPYLANHRRELVLGALSLVVTDALVLLTPQLQAMAIHAIETRVQLRTVFIYSFSVFGAIAAASVFRYYWRIFYIKASLSIAYELRNDLFKKLMAQPPGFFGKFTTGDIMARATNDLEAVRMAVGPGTLVSMDVALMGIPSIAMLFAIDAKLALLTFVPGPFLAVAVWYFQKKIHAVFEQVQARFSDLSEKARENFSGIRVIKSYVQEDAEIENFRALSRAYVRDNMKLANIEGVFQPAVMFFATLSLILIMVLGLGRVIDGTMDFGKFWAFNEYMLIIVWPMVGIGWVVGLIQRGTASMKRLRELFDVVPEVRDPEAAADASAVRGDIDMRGVGFRYSDDGPWVLRDIDLSIRAGEKVAVVGRVGAGKSALIGLLLRFHDPQEGEVRLDGVDVRRYALRDLRGAFGLVPQETFLFSDTIRGNIVFGADGTSDAEVERMAAAAGLEENIREFPDRFETVVGERGVTLSGGQKQRTAIARALIVKPRVVLFDDAFSNLDTETEEKILGNLRGAWADRTVLLVSHRVSTVKDFDTIVVIEQGRIIEQGSHRELLDRRGAYWRMFERQRLQEALA